ncbi:hypothetical protein [Pelomonas sp. SE-A7]|uniref:hypothetical protein n=1 Tax=Pelomonas sp. SE-A7 TaxID=3054953 RepID=UPI00259C836A|nr:hypothetical protein [Pelomonas sp. SE-A7]MDM4767144.1 hypothetical protein [Pelomonas sp. SE-A7]
MAAVRFLARWSVRLLLLGLLTLVILALLAVQTEPSVPVRASTSAADLDAARALLRRADPRQGPLGRSRVLVASERELDLMLNYAVRHGGLGASELKIEQGELRARLSRPLVGLWLNLELRLAQGPGLPDIAGGRLGRLPLPRPLLRYVAFRLLERYSAVAGFQLAGDLVQRVEFQPQRALLVYVWQADSTQRALASLVPAALRQRAHVYWNLVQRQLPPGYEFRPVVEVLPQLAAEALKRAADSDEDLSQESRALLMALAMHATGRGPSTLLPGTGDWASASPTWLAFVGRQDFGQHFLISAALACEAGGPLADAIGLQKELADARDGSGFSFNDIAADRAGSRFGSWARQRPREFLQTLAAGVVETQLFPPVADLPEFLHEKDFRRRYGGPGAPAYRQMMEEIEHRLQALPLGAPG